ncbi:MAG: ROK family protein [Bacilli bacterium]|nr:ROK family protein [Bacilli bacterium]
MNYIPSIDKNFSPLILKLRAYNEKVSKSSEKSLLEIVLERHSGYNYFYQIVIFKDGTGHDEENYDIVERLIKSMLWVVGGYKIYIKGSHYIYTRTHQDYLENGARAFDSDFMANVYEKPFEVVEVLDKLPAFKEEKVKINTNLDGCRIGFDAGGSDRKVSAVVNGKVIYSEETVWFPKINSDPKYQYSGILESMKTAASKMPRVDAIGVSSAGIYVNNRIMVASLFLKVSKEDFDKHVKNMYIDIAKEFGDVPLVVANDGDVTALAGAMDLKDNEVLGIAMGTSEATGYVDEHGNLKGWLNELAFVPVDANKDAMVDEWSGDYGCGVKYFSQDGVIKLAEMAGFTFDKELSPAEKLKVIQKLRADNDELAIRIYQDLGIYLGYTLAYYAHFYKIKHVLLLGRVTSGKGGEDILNMAKTVLHNEFTEYKDVDILMPDEKSRRVGQSIAAASLPKI